MTRCKLPCLRPRCLVTALLLFGLACSTLLAGYKSRPWQIRGADGYASRLASEGVTIAVEPLFRDDLAAVVFDKNDIVTRGIIPLAAVIFNGNDFPVRVDAESIELINGDDRLHTLQPGEVVARVFKKGSKGNWIPNPIPMGIIDSLPDGGIKYAIIRPPRTRILSRGRIRKQRIKKTSARRGGTSRRMYVLRRESLNHPNRSQIPMLSSEVFDGPFHLFFPGYDREQCF